MRFSTRFRKDPTFLRASSLKASSPVYSWHSHRSPVQNPSVHSILSMIPYAWFLVADEGNLVPKYSILHLTWSATRSMAAVTSSRVRNRAAS